MAVRLFRETQLMDIRSLYQGFLFGVRVGNNINGNTVDIEPKVFAVKLAELASRTTTLIPTGAELQNQFNGFAIPEAVLRDLVFRDQELATMILQYLQAQDPRMGQGSNPS